MSENKVAGRCYCGNIQYSITGEFKNTSICFCEDCRRISAAPNVAWITINKKQFQITQGKPDEYASSEKVIRLFCKKCGSHLAYTNKDRADDIDVTACSLENPNVFVPKEEFGLEYKLQWSPHYLKVQ